MSQSLVWLRRDLRLHDHHALSEALKNAESVHLVFVFDELILSNLKDKDDLRITFIVDSLKEIESELQKHGGSLHVLNGDPTVLVPHLCEELNCSSLYFNRDYEAYAKARDHKVEKILKTKNISVHHFKDHVFYEKHEVLSGTNEIYKVFTPYKNKWLDKFRSQDSVVTRFDVSLKKITKWSNPHSILKSDIFKKIGFIENVGILKGGTCEALKRLSAFKKYISNYKEARDIPALEQTSNLSTYIRMGNLSIRDMIKVAIEDKTSGHETWLSEIIWRDFYQMILDVYPRVEKSSFKPQYDAIEWQGNKDQFQKWCDGETGYPIVDAAMRCLNATGMMHNRLRMIVASFLTKTLLIDWRLGEEYFARKLFDFDLAANNGGWQWSASTGVDAQPYFRIFNPYSQSEKFDEQGTFIKTWCPELSHVSVKKIHAPHEMDLVEQAQSQCIIGKDYPYPIVEYKVQRDRALKMYKEIR